MCFPTVLAYKSVVCSKSWPTFYVGQQCWPFMNLFVFLLAIKWQTVRGDWLAVANVMAAEWTDVSCVDYTNYTSPFYHCIIHDCIQMDFGRLRFHLRAIKQITAAATSSSSAESAISAILLSNKMLSCVTQMLANKCWPINVDQQLLANICWSCVCGFRL